MEIALVIAVILALVVGVTSYKKRSSKGKDTE